MKADPTFETEAELCEAFIAWGKQHGYTAYPETADFDILLVDSQGFQIGVEAKLRLNLKVVMQALPGGYGQEIGPDHRAVLVPSMDGDLREICKHLGIEIFYCTTRMEYALSRPAAYSFHWDDEHSGRPMFDWNPTRRCKLPDYMPDVAAGVPSPIRLTEWKTGALKVLAHLAIHGVITRKQIKAYGLDSRAWCGPRSWLLPYDGDPKRDGRWKRGEKCPAFDKQHPTVFEQIKAELTAAGEPVGQVSLGVI